MAEEHGGLSPKDVISSPAERRQPVDETNAFGTFTEQTTYHHRVNVFDTLQSSAGVISIISEEHFGPRIAPSQTGENSVQPNRPYVSSRSEILIAESPEDFVPPEEYVDVTGDKADYIVRIEVSKEANPDYKGPTTAADKVADTLADQIPDQRSTPIDEPKNVKYAYVTPEMLREMTVQEGKLLLLHPKIGQVRGRVSSVASLHATQQAV